MFWQLESECPAAELCHMPRVQLQRALKILGLSMTLADVEFLMMEIDDNGDGEVRLRFQAMRACSVVDEFFHAAWYIVGTSSPCPPGSSSCRRRFVAESAS